MNQERFDLGNQNLTCSTHLLGFHYLGSIGWTGREAYCVQRRANSSVEVDLLRFFKMPSRAMGMFQWLPFCNKWYEMGLRKRSGLMQRHKLTAKRPPSCTTGVR